MIIFYAVCLKTSVVIDQWHLKQICQGLSMSQVFYFIFYYLGWP